MELAPGREVEKYVVEGVLGRGGCAIVYRVRHARLGSIHALKVLLPLGPDMAERLLQEGRVQAGLRHPNIVAVTDVLDVDGLPALVMEYVPPPSLAQWLRDRRLSLAEAETVFGGIVAGVQHAHRLGLVHRDLKPSNVLLAFGDFGMVPKVSDFGLAKVLAQGPSDRTRSGSAMGTPLYMAPEQFRDARTIDVRADVFSLGCILHELVSGAPPFEEGDLIGVYEQVAAGRMRPLPEGTPDRVRRAIDGALEPDRERRLAHCAALLAVLRGEPPPELDVAAETPATSWSQEAAGIPSRAEPATRTMAGMPASSEPTPRGRVAARRIAVAVFLAGVAVVAVLAPWGRDAPADLTEPAWEAALVPAARDAGPAVAAPAAAVSTSPAPATPAPPATASAARPPRGRVVDQPLRGAVAAELVPAPAESTVEAVLAGPPPGAGSAVGADAATADPSTPAASRGARVEVRGARRAWLEADGTRVVLPGQVSPGTWTVRADFGAGAVRAGVVDVADGEAVTVACDETFQTCARR